MKALGAALTAMPSGDEDHRQHFHDYSSNKTYIFHSRKIRARILSDQTGELLR
jgi:hypothetical protein